MKVKDIIKLITDDGVFVELVHVETNASYGFNRKNAPIFQYDDRIKNAKVKKMNVQYFKNHRVLVLYIER